jgi:hypothetical protein
MNRAYATAGRSTKNTTASALNVRIVLPLGEAEHDPPLPLVILDRGESRHFTDIVNRSRMTHRDILRRRTAATDGAIASHRAQRAPCKRKVTVRFGSAPFVTRRCATRAVSELGCEPYLAFLPAFLPALPPVSPPSAGS